MCTNVNHNYGVSANGVPLLLAVPLSGIVRIVVKDLNEKIQGETTATQQGEWRDTFCLDDGTYIVEFKGAFRPIGSGFRSIYNKPIKSTSITIVVPLTGTPATIPPDPTVGSVGATGPAGPSGPMGTIGVTGEQGEDGLPGETGPAGTIGTAGPAGPAGPAGLAGAAGIQGTIGTAGSQGSPGLDGSRGAGGQDGSFGGYSHEFFWDSDTSVAYLEGRSVGTNSGDLKLDNLNSDGIDVQAWIQSFDDFGSAASRGVLRLFKTDNSQIFAFYEVIGSVADQGSFWLIDTNGVVDSNGAFFENDRIVVTFTPAGDIGATGATGPSGTDGIIGATGVIGATGAIGADGTVGATGADGTVGATGVAGATGAIGDIGGIGATGPEGTQTYISVSTNDDTTNQALEANPFDENDYPATTLGVTTHASNGIALDKTTGLFTVSSTGTYVIRANLILVGDLGPSRYTGRIKVNGSKVWSTSDFAPIDDVAQYNAAIGPNINTWDLVRDLSVNDTVSFTFEPTTGFIDCHQNSTATIFKIAGSGGPIGPDGAIGATGPSGGPVGDNGATGATGARGARGAVGTAGQTGATGPSGTDGTNGTNGAIGTTGPIGATGPSGPSGTDGIIGATGVIGATGPVSPDEVTTATILTDNALIRGDGGAKGVQDSGILIDDTDNISAIGNIALTGTVDGRDVSVDGATLDAHDVGTFTHTQIDTHITNAAAHASIGSLVGEANIQTLTGKTLLNPTLTLKQSTTPTPTTEGDIQWDTDNNQIKIGDGSGTLTFSDDSVGAGPTGPTGATGAAGPTGATGAAGPIGDTGAAGDPGAVGETGPIGATGPIGIDGVDGLTGETGVIGATGASGTGGSVTWSRTIHIPNPKAADEFTVIGFPAAATLTKIRGERAGGTSVTFNLEERAEGSFLSAGTNVFTVDEVLTANESWTVFNNAGLAADSILVYSASAVSGAVTDMVLLISGTYD